MDAAAKKQVRAAESLPFRNLGLALAILRELKEMSQTDLAKAAGMGKGQISKYERGKELPKLDSLGRTLEVLDTSPLALFYVVHLLDQVEAGERSFPLILESRFSPVITEAEQEAFTRLLKSALGVFFEQITARVGLGLRFGKRAQEDPGLAEEPEEVVNR